MVVKCCLDGPKKPPSRFAACFNTCTASERQIQESRSTTPPASSPLDPLPCYQCYPSAGAEQTTPSALYLSSQPSKTPPLLTAL
eukprot:1603605-Prymnesium_polylepis.2